MMFDALMRDFRFGARGLARTPAFAVAAILTLAIGIGATTAVFSVVYGVLLRPLPFPTADRLVRAVSRGARGLPRIRLSSGGRRAGRSRKSDPIRAPRCR
jgi:hypothetical protein